MVNESDEPDEGRVVESRPEMNQIRVETDGIKT
jgi:hypothetical protein